MLLPGGRQDACVYLAATCAYVYLRLIKAFISYSCAKSCCVRRNTPESLAILLYHRLEAFIGLDKTKNKQNPNRFMAKPGKTGLTRIIHAFYYSMQGLAAAMRYESAFRQELVMFLVMLPLAFWLGQSAVQDILLIGSLLLVLIVELLNSAVEAVVDRVGEEHNELAGRAKDMGSAAVFVSLANVVFVWAVVAWLRFFH